MEGKRENEYTHGIGKASVKPSEREGWGVKGPLGGQHNSYPVPHQDPAGT